VSTPETELALRAEAAAELIGRERDEAVIEAGIVQAIEDATVNTSIRTVAKVKAMVEAYCRIHTHFINFVVDQARRMDLGEFEQNPFKEISVARLVAQWLIEAEEFIDTNEHLLKDTAQVIKKRFVEEALEGLPAAIRTRILDELQEKRNTIAVWLVTEIDKAKKEAAVVDEASGIQA